ncbi:putative NUDIX family NTP pyrophosphohydrolase [Catenuloplanes nepalensis]|uniref:NUDIX family NTP pyrophosphohydrolase n=1 Tax=Catenuloplanes nepalensis TaxID=587533 RepID=A0ABT9MWQ1_9ACTN|nr:NUDIX domain-containing protein [Catenuloplanes nepalensis]MDP9795814.1 putative NUDIX family NTP pyrophosphohydrolase [Catenuloplanes nepalensis]
MAKKSAGILVFRLLNNVVEVLLVHPGGPLWARKDDGSWSIPKGEYTDDDDPLNAAVRELSEETGIEADLTQCFTLGEIKQKGGKVVTSWALETDFDITQLKSNTFQMEWPRNSGVIRDYPEVDRAEWFPITAAKTKLLTAQAPLLDRLVERLKSSGRGPLLLDASSTEGSATLF